MLNDKIIADMDAAEGTALQRLLQSIFDKAIKDNNPDVNKVLDQDIKYWFDITSDMSGPDVECFLDAMRRGKTVCAAHHLTRILFSIGTAINKVRERFCKNIALHAKTNEVTEPCKNKGINAAHLYQFRKELFVDKRYSEAFDKLASDGNWMGIVELMTEARMNHVVNQYLVHKGDILTVNWEMMPLDGSVTLTIKHGDGIIYSFSYPGRTTEAQEMMKLLPPGTYYAMRTFGTSLISRLNITKMQNELLAKKDETSHLAEEVKPEHEAPKPVDPECYKLTLDERIGVPIIPAFEDLEGMVRQDVFENDNDWPIKVNTFIDTLRFNFPVNFGKTLEIGQTGDVLTFGLDAPGKDGVSVMRHTEKATLLEVINTLQACVYASPLYDKDDELAMTPCAYHDRVDTVFVKFNACKEVIINNYQKLVHVGPNDKLEEAYLIKHETVIVPSDNEPEPIAAPGGGAGNASKALYDISDLSSYYKGYKSTSVVREEIGRNITALFGYDVTKNVNFNRELYLVVQDVIEKFADVRNDKTTVAVIGSVLQICKMLATTLVKNEDGSIKSCWVDMNKLHSFIIKLYGCDLSGVSGVSDLRYHVMSYLKSNAN